MGNVFSSSKSKQNERYIEELRQRLQTFMTSTNNRFNRYDAILEELRNMSRGHEQLIRDNRSILNELRQLNSDRTNNRSRRREEAEDENAAPFPDRERDHQHDGDLVQYIKNKIKKRERA